MKNIKPNDEAVNRMYHNITNSKRKKRKENSMNKIKLRLLLPAFAFVILVAGGALFSNFIPTGEDDNDNGGSQLIERDNIGEVPEDSVAVITNQFQINDRYYTIMSEELRAEFNLTEAIKEEDIGNKIITITTSVDANLIGKEVFEYLPGGSEAVVAVRVDNEYKLFHFFTFESYINNQDEDVIEYLNLYGIYKSEDINKFQLIGHSEEAKIEGRIDILNEITDPGEILKFYNYYSEIKNSSTKYFDKLFNYQSSDQGNQILIPEDKPEQAPDQIAPDFPEDIDPNEKETTVSDVTLPDTPVSDQGSTSEVNDISQGNGEGTEGSSGGSSIGGSAGTVGNALSNSVTIRIYNQQGIYFDAVYYPNLGFISRHEVNDAFADFLEGLIK